MGQDLVIEEARWPMASAVLVAMVLTVLMPDEVRLGPPWLIPLLTGVLLVVLIIGDPGRISRRSSVLRGFSIALVSVLAAEALWSTARLIDQLIEGGPHTSEPGPLLAAGAIVWISNNIAFALLYWELDGAGPQPERTSSPPIPISRFPSS
jgi:hypothetical protein